MNEHPSIPLLMKLTQERSVALRERDAALARAEMAERAVEAFHDWVGDYRGPLPAELRLLIRGNDRGHSDSVSKVMKVADDFEAWIEDGKELLASYPDPAEERTTKTK